MKFKPLIALILFAILLPLSAFSDDPKSGAEKAKKNTAAQKMNEDQKTPDLDQILANYYKAIGGLDRWQNLDTMIHLRRLLELNVCDHDRITKELAFLATA
ncbi:hypothetical protein IH785_09340 [candidate division KSB1 bacterium]|nr:hypothetical protein [candidate division KSB1 bacterium]